MKRKMSFITKELDISARRIIEYEKMGLIKPEREDKTNDRLFSDFEIKQVKKIQDLIHIHGFTLKSLVYLLNIAPCWKIYNCKKTKCIAYMNISNQCWKLTKHDVKTLCDIKCERCAIYLASRKTKKIKLLEVPKASKL